MGPELTPLRIAALGLHVSAAGDAPTPLRERLRERLSRPPRRVNRLIELALIGAVDCIGDCPLPADTPVLLALSSGCVADSAQLLSDSLQDNPAMPVRFINVSSNMAGFYVAQQFGLSGSCQVVSRETGSWAAALELAAIDPATGGLVAALEEAAWPMDSHRERLGLATDAPVLESSAWLRLADDGEMAVADCRLGPPREPLATLQQRAHAWASEHESVLDVHGEVNAAAELELPRWASRHTGHSGHADALHALEFLQHGRGQLIQLQIDADGRGSGRCFRRLIGAGESDRA